ncbi:hypothetical protein FXO38_18585 [Capsicum annuum]|nr:hypothetical protein FXO38_18585 [Capsicum annuum]
MPAGAETSRPLLEEHGNSTKDEVNRVKPLKDVKNQQRKSCPTWWLLLLVSIFVKGRAMVKVRKVHGSFWQNYLDLEQRMNKFPIYPKYEAGDYCGYEFDPQTDYTDTDKKKNQRIRETSKGSTINKPSVDVSLVQCQESVGRVL